MKNEYFTLRSPFRDLIRWIRRYAEVFPPPGCKTLRMEEEPPLRHGDDVNWSFGAKSFSLQPDGAVVPLFEVYAQAAHGDCRVHMRCHAPSLESWFETMLDRLAPTRASDQPQPLPALPERSSANAPAPPAAGPAEAPTAPAPATAEQAEPPQALTPTPSAPATAEQGEPPEALPPAPKSARAGRLPPGRKGFTPEEIERWRKRWFSRPAGMSVEAFCHQEAISPSTFRK